MELAAALTLGAQGVNIGPDPGLGRVRNPRRAEARISPPPVTLRTPYAGPTASQLDDVTPAAYLVNRLITEAEAVMRDLFALMPR